MVLYEGFVNYSMFDGEITLASNGKKHLLSTVFSIDPSNRDIFILIDGVRYNARLMNVPTSQSVQISYGTDVQETFKRVFSYSYYYIMKDREQAKRDHLSTRNLLTPDEEGITISETDESLVFLVEYFSPYTEDISFDASNPDSDDQLYFPEGGKSFRQHASYERNPALVKLAKKQFKQQHDGSLFCEVCDFSFDKYGDRGHDFIEAHHDVPVSELGEGAVTHLKDIRMVCANCHRVLHRKRPWLKVAELRAYLESRSR